MESVVSRAGVWLALLFISIAAMAAAADWGFAVHMGVFALAAFTGLVIALRTTDFQAAANGILNVPADESRYDDELIRYGVIATVFWGMAGFLVGLVIALQMGFPVLNLGLEWTSFGRLRPLHTSAVIFAFGGSALIATSFYVVQRTCRARLAFPGLARFVFWGYQLFIVLAATGYLLGISQGKEYAEPEWYVD
ncbi:MAG: cbb3-type cytochrome c oxidase subunit I, partial [Brevundimonas sp.]|nr:cbb3-type cytochrome c oxidase subunit I [Brevundimonas sp.]